MSKELTVIQWNVLSNKLDDCFDVSIDDSKWENRCVRIKNTIEQYQPVILGMEELTDDMLQDLNFTSNMKVACYKKKSDSPEEHGCALLYNSDILQLSDVIAYQYTNSSQVAICARFNVELRSFFVALTHLKHGYENEDIRFQQMQEFLQLIDKFRMKDEAGIVMGDFNTTPRTYTIELLQKSGYFSIFELESNLLTTKKKRNDVLKECMEDYIFTYMFDWNWRISLPELNKCPDETLPSKKIGSDHLPLIANISFW